MMIEDEDQGMQIGASEDRNPHASADEAEGAASPAAEGPATGARKPRDPAFDAQRRDRRRLMAELLEASGITDEDALSIMMNVQALLPDQTRMTPLGSLAQRIEQAIKDVNAAHPVLLFSKSGKAPLNLADTERAFRGNAQLSKLMDNEEGLLRALILNERVRSGIALKLAEHDAAKAMILTELARRDAVLEHWRYMLPKYMLPLYSMIDAADAERNNLRVGGDLFKRMLGVLIEWSGGSVTREQLLEAAARTEDQFLSVLKEKAAQSASGEREPMAALRDCLAQQIQDLEETIAGLDESDEAARPTLSAQRDRLAFAWANGAGLDAQGRVVLPGLDGLSNIAEAVTDNPDTLDALRAAKAGSKTAMGSAGGDDGAIDDEDEEELFSGGMTDPFAPFEEAGSVPAGEGCAEGDLLSDESLRAFVDEVGGLPEGFGLRREITDPKVLEAMARRASKFAKVDGTPEPFGGWICTDHPAPEAYPPLREPDPYALSEKTLGMIDFVRVEVPRGPVDAVVVKGQSLVLGEADALMFPPYARLDWYADKLGLSDPDKRLMSAYTLTPKFEELGGENEAMQVVGWLRQVADSRIKEMLETKPDHLLADAAKREIALDHLSRWWAFMLFVRGNMEVYTRFYRVGYFHGVHGLDCVLDGHFLVPNQSFVLLIDDQVRELERMPLTRQVKAQLDQPARHPMQRVFRPADSLK